MMNIRSWPFAAIAFALLPTAAAGQDVLSRDDAVGQALAHNASLRSTRAGADEAAARTSEAKAGWFPRVTVTEAWRRGDEPVFVFSSLLSARRFTAANFAIDALNHPAPTSFFQSAVGVEQVLFDGGQQRAAVDAAHAQQTLSQLGVDEARAHLALVTTEMYGRVVAAEAGRRAAEAALRAGQQDRTRAGDRRDAGMATDADVLALDAYLADLEQRRIQYDGDAAISRAELNRLMGAPIDKTYLVLESHGATPQRDAADLQALFAEAEANRPEIQRTTAASQLAHAERAGARAAIIPQVAAQAAVDWSGTNFGDRASSWIVGAEARWNLSLGGAERARLKGAASAETRASAEAESVRAAVQVDVFTAFQRCQSAAAKLAAGRAAIADAQESERIVRNRFESGLATVTDLMRASSAITDAEARRIAAGVDAMVSEAQLQWALGHRP